jgi:hypothetical protein
MAVSYKTKIAAANLLDNAPRWDGTAAGHYEVWFLTLNHKATQRGFWLRYTIEAPETALSQQPSFEVWAGYFERKRPEANFVIHQPTSLSTLGVDRESGLVLKLDRAALYSEGSTGDIEAQGHQVSWDLSFVPNEETYHHISPAMIRLAKPSSFVLSPNLDTRFNGAITVDGREIVLKDEPGCQSHLWGRKHVDDWVWVHSNAFEKHPGTVFEGLAARPRRAGRTLPPVYSLMLNHRGEEHRFVRLRFAEQWQRRLGMGIWSFTASSRRLHIDGVAQCRLRDMLQVEYVDPDGEPLYCINSEVANLKIRLFRRVHGVRWRHVETISAIGTSHLEHASRQVDENVRMAFRRVIGER